MRFGANEFKGFDDPIEIFRAGTHVGGSGNKIIITRADLDQMVENFSSEDRVPYVKGHPEIDDPAYGWASALYVEDGSFHNRSVAIAKGDTGWRVRHIGWLGERKGSTGSLSFGMRLLTKQTNDHSRHQWGGIK